MGDRITVVFALRHTYTCSVYSPTSINKIVCNGQVFLGFHFSFIPSHISLGFLCLGNLPPPSLISVIIVKIILVSALRVVFSDGLVVKKSPGMKETQVRSWDWEDPGGGNGKPLQYSCARDPMDRGTQGLKTVRCDLATEQQQQRL